MNDGADQSQSKPGAAAFSGRIAPIKTIKNMLLRVRGDTRSIVLDLQNGRAVLLLQMISILPPGAYI